jgi:hypothetical protein
VFTFSAGAVVLFSEEGTQLMQIMTYLCRREILIVRHFDGMLSLYRGTPHLGLICPPVDARPGFAVMWSTPFCDTREDRTFEIEQAAIDYLSAEQGR